MPDPRQPGRRKSIDAAQLDAELLGTAFSLFDAPGFHAVTLAAIAQRAHVAVRTIYAGFGGKRGLLAALIAREHSRHAHQLTLLDHFAAGLDAMRACTCWRSTCASAPEIPYSLPCSAT